MLDETRGRGAPRQPPSTAGTQLHAQQGPGPDGKRRDLSEAGSHGSRQEGQPVPPGPPSQGGLPKRKQKDYKDGKTASTLNP